MKNILLILLFSIATNSFAAQLNLSAGETAIIEANTLTTVTCEKNQTSSCLPYVEKAEASYKACSGSGYSNSYCFDRAYPAKVQNCVPWSESCNKACKNSGYSPSYCYDKCY